PTRRPRTSFSAKADANQTSHPTTSITKCNLVFEIIRAKRRDETGCHTLVDALWQINQPTPAFRVLKADDTAESPRERLNRLGHPISRVDRHSSSGRKPHRSLESGISERLNETHSVVKAAEQI